MSFYFSQNLTVNSTLSNEHTEFQQEEFIRNVEKWRNETTYSPPGNGIESIEQHTLEEDSQR